MDYDVVVVGAGIMGIASAYHIQSSSPGKRVLVLDRLADAGQANTGRSNAMFRNTFTSADNQLLADSSIDFYAHVQRELGVDIGLDPMGYLWLVSEERLSASEGHARRMAANGVEMRRYDRGALERMVPGLVARPRGEQASLLGLEGVEAGYFGPKCGRLAPERLVRFYLERFLALGGRAMFGAEVERLLVEPSDRLGVDGEPFVWQESRVTGVRLAGGRELRAGTVVVAAGAWANEVLDPAGIDGRVKAKKRQLFAVSAEGNEGLARLLGTTGFSASGTLPFTILPGTGLFVKAVKESGEFWVGCEDELNRPFISLPEHDLDRYPAEPAYYEMNVHQVLREYLPQFEGARPSRMWAGLYSYNTLDNLPFVFAGDGFIAAGGDSGSGVMKGDSLGRVVSAVYAHGEDATVELYGGRRYGASKLGFRHRDVEREEWVI